MFEVCLHFERAKVTLVGVLLNSGASRKALKYLARSNGASLAFQDIRQPHSARAFEGREGYR